VSSGSSGLLCGQYETPGCKSELGLLLKITASINESQNQTTLRMSNAFLNI